MRFYVGKGMELAGLVLMAYGLWAGITLHSERLEVLFVGIAIAVFFLGWLLERKARG